MKDAWIEDCWVVKRLKVVLPLVPKKFIGNVKSVGRNITGNLFYHANCKYKMSIIQTKYETRVY